MNLVTGKIFWTWWEDIIIYSLITSFLSFHLANISIYFPENQRLWNLIYCYLMPADILLHFIILIADVWGFALPVFTQNNSIICFPKVPKNKLTPFSRPGLGRNFLFSLLLLLFLFYCLFVCFLTDDWFDTTLNQCLLVLFYVFTYFWSELWLKSFLLLHTGQVAGN